MSHLPKEIVDKITNKAMEMFPKHPNKKSPVYVDIYYQEKQQAYILGGWFAALHYSTIIEQKDRQIDELKLANMTHEYNEAEAKRFRPEYERQLLDERDAEIKRLNAIIKKFEERAKFWNILKTQL